MKNKHFFVALIAIIVFSTCISCNSSKDRSVDRRKPDDERDRGCSPHETLFEAFDRFELDNLSYMNEVDNHYEQSEQTEISLNRRAATPQEPVEETVARKLEVDKLHAAIAKLPDTQRRRLIMYYFGDLTYQQSCAYCRQRPGVDYVVTPKNGSGSL